MRLAVAMIVSLLAVFAWAGATRTPQPVIAPAKAGTQCIAPSDEMRRDHMRMLEHQRDQTVHGGLRGAKASLKACVDCHAGAQTRSVASSAEDFCVSCHRYAAVKLDCFECHSSRPAVAGKGLQ